MGPVAHTTKQIAKYAFVSLLFFFVSFKFGSLQNDVGSLFLFTRNNKNRLSLARVTVLAACI